MYSEFGFGKVYLDKDKNPESAYFSNFTMENNSFLISFHANFNGLGLPSRFFNEFYSLMKNVTSDIVCSSEVGGNCTISQNCTDLTILNDYAFQLVLSDD